MFILAEDALLEPLANYISVIVDSRRKGLRTGIELTNEVF